MQLSPIDLTVAVLFGAALIVFGILGARLIEKIPTKTGSFEDKAKSAIESWLGVAAFAGDRVLIIAFSEVEKDISGLDAKAIADSVYNLLPGAIAIDGIQVPIGLIKTAIGGQAGFETLVEEWYQKTDAFILANIDYLKKQKLPAVAVLKAYSATPLTGTVTLPNGETGYVNPPSAQG